MEYVVPEIAFKDYASSAGTDHGAPGGEVGLASKRFEGKSDKVGYVLLSGCKIRMSRREPEDENIFDDQFGPLGST